MGRIRHSYNYLSWYHRRYSDSINNSTLRHFAKLLTDQTLISFPFWSAKDRAKFYRNYVLSRSSELKMSPEAWLEGIEGSPKMRADEWDILLRKGGIHKTRFFRERSLFNFLKKELARKATSDSSQQPLRLLSLGCSTGEECYSLAAALSGRRLRRKVYVHGVDLSATAIQFANFGRYPVNGNSARLTRTERDALFDKKPTQHSWWRIKRSLRSKVSFSVQNAANWQPDLRFHIIVCRNMIWYFSENDRTELIKKLTKSLKPGGLLCFSEQDPVPLTLPGLTKLTRGRFRKPI